MPATHSLVPSSAMDASVGDIPILYIAPSLPAPVYPASTTDGSRRRDRTPEPTQPPHQEATTSRHTSRRARSRSIHTAQPLLPPMSTPPPPPHAASSPRPSDPETREANTPPSPPPAPVPTPAQSIAARLAALPDRLDRRVSDECGFGVSYGRWNRSLTLAEEERQVWINRMQEIERDLTAARDSIKRAQDRTGILMSSFLKEPETRDPRFEDCRKQLWLLKTLHTTAYSIPVVQNFAYARKREMMLRLRSEVVAQSRDTETHDSALRFLDRSRSQRWALRSVERCLAQVHHWVKAQRVADGEEQGREIPEHMRWESGLPLDIERILGAVDSLMAHCVGWVAREQWACFPWLRVAIWDVEESRFD